MSLYDVAVQVHTKKIMSQCLKHLTALHFGLASKGAPVQHALEMRVRPRRWPHESSPTLQWNTSTLVVCDRSPFTLCFRHLGPSPTWSIQFGKGIGQIGHVLAAIPTKECKRNQHWGETCWLSLLSQMERFVKDKASVLVCHESFLFVPPRSKHVPSRNRANRVYMCEIPPVTLEVSTIQYPNISQDIKCMFFGSVPNCGSGWKWLTECREVKTCLIDPSSTKCVVPLYQYKQLKQIDCGHPLSFHVAA